MVYGLDFRTKRGNHVTDIVADRWLWLSAEIPPIGGIFRYGCIASADVGDQAFAGRAHECSSSPLDGGGNRVVSGGRTRRRRSNGETGSINRSDADSVRCDHIGAL